MKRIAFIPARGGSKRLPRKNILPVGGYPMIYYPIQTALKSNLFTEVIVSTDDYEIAKLAKNYGAKALMRPDEFATDDSAELDACHYHLNQLKKSSEIEPFSFCVIYPTAILITPEDLIKSEALLHSNPIPDVVMGVCDYPLHPYKALKIKENGYLESLFPEECQWRTQFYPPVRASNGTLYWLKTEPFYQNRDYYVDKLVPYTMPLDRSIDVDTQEDYDHLLKIFNLKEKLI